MTSSGKSINSEKDLLDALAFAANDPNSPLLNAMFDANAFEAIET